MIPIWNDISAVVFYIIGKQNQLCREVMSAPQCPQNFASLFSGSPHTGHFAVSFLSSSFAAFSGSREEPHCVQNFSPSGFTA